LRRVESDNRLTFTHLGEQWLDSWMQENAFVSWIVHSEPSQIEHDMLKLFNFSINLHDNGHRAFTKDLSLLRQNAFESARKPAIATKISQRKSVK